MLKISYVLFCFLFLEFLCMSCTFASNMYAWAHRCKSHLFQQLHSQATCMHHKLVLSLSRNIIWSLKMDQLLVSGFGSTVKAFRVDGGLVKFIPFSMSLYSAIIRNHFIICKLQQVFWDVKSAHDGSIG